MISFAIIFGAFAIVVAIVNLNRSRDDYFEEMTEREKFDSSGRGYLTNDEFEYVRKFRQEVEYDGKVVFVVPKKPKSKNLSGTTWYFYKHTKHYTLRDGGHSCNCSGYLLHNVRCYHMRMVEEARRAGVFDFKIRGSRLGSPQIFYVPLRSDNATELTRVKVIKKSKNKEIKYVCETCIKTKDLVCKHAEAVIAAAQSGEIVIR